MGRPAVAPEIRFWAKVDTSGGPDACWPWRAARNREGYGTFALSPTVQVRANRMALELSGAPVPEGFWALHRCDNPPCCNPAHLFIGTAADNAHDMAAKGRAYRGPQTPEWIAKRVASYHVTMAARPRPLKTHCVHGHEYTPENTIKRKRGRQCRTCVKAWKREDYRRHHEVPAAIKARTSMS